MNRVDYFEMPVEDMERAIAFYENVFGWKITREDRASGPYFSVKTGDADSPGINGSFFKRSTGWTRIQNIINVKDIDSSIAKIQERSGKITFAKCAINGVGYLAYFEDPDGNPFGMMQHDPSVQEEEGI